jgi:hypothetical protein
LEEHAVSILKMDLQDEASKKPGTPKATFTPTSKPQI